MRRTPLLVVVIALAGLGLALSFYKVEPDSVALVMRNNEIVRVEQPGLRWHLPVFEEIGLIPVHRHFRQEARFEARLADGSTCPIVAELAFRIADPSRAFTWRREHGLDMSADARRNDAEDFKEAARSFKTAANAALREISPNEAAAGAVSAWIKAYRHAVHADGTQILAAEPSAVGCEPVKQTDHVRRKPEPASVLGPINPFKRTLQRTDTPGTKVHEFSATAQEVIARDGRRVWFEPLTVRYAVTDTARFEAAFTGGVAAHRYAAPRLDAMLAAQLRLTVGSLTTDELPAFDPLTLAQPGTRVASGLEHLGIRILDIDGERSGYRLWEARD